MTSFDFKHSEYDHIVNVYVLLASQSYMNTFTQIDTDISGFWETGREKSVWNGKKIELDVYNSSKNDLKQLNVHMVLWGKTKLNEKLKQSREKSQG